MKIIDLLNKIANDEEVPNAIKFNDIIYKKADIGKDYYNFTINKWFFKDVFDASGVNLEVEILEGKKEIPEKLNEFGIIQYNLDYIDYKNIETLKQWLNKDFQTIYDTLDLIIKNQNKLIDYLKSKGE